MRPAWNMMFPSELAIIFLRFYVGFWGLLPCRRHVGRRWQKKIKMRHKLSRQWHQISLVLWTSEKLSLLQTERICSSWQQYHVWNELKVETVPQQIRHKHKTIENFMSSWRHVGCCMKSIHMLSPGAWSSMPRRTPLLELEVVGQDTLFFPQNALGVIPSGYD